MGSWPTIIADQPAFIPNCNHREALELGLYGLYIGFSTPRSLTCTDDTEDSTFQAYVIVLPHLPLSPRLVTKDTVEDRNAATPHPSAEQDMKKMAEEKKKIGTDHETEKGGNEGNAEAFDK